MPDWCARRGVVAELVELRPLGAVHELHPERVVDHGDMGAGPVREPESASRGDGADREACSFVEVRDEREAEAPSSRHSCAVLRSSRADASVRAPSRRLSEPLPRIGCIASRITALTSLGRPLMSRRPV
jgi:hypothetical protein